MFTRRKKTVTGGETFNSSSPQLPSASSMHVSKGGEVSTRLRSKTAHMSMYVGRRNSTVLNAISTDDLSLLNKSINAHDDVSRGSVTARARTNTIQSTESKPSVSNSDKHNEDIDRLKRQMATMLENLEDSDDDCDLSDSSITSPESIHYDIGEHNQKRSHTVGVNVPPLFQLSSDEDMSPIPRARSYVHNPSKRLSDASLLATSHNPPNFNDRYKKKRFGSVVGDIRKSIMLRRQSVFTSPSSPVVLDTVLPNFSPLESPRRSNTEQRSIEYKDYTCEEIVEAERKRLRDLRQFSPQLVLEGFHREAKLNDMYFKSDIYYEKRESSLVSFAKALSG
ncbi:hypothetical protein AKO1_008910 [Acrasis kona]|uniref:Uncharacterized protein n=1 Tax=Acrasis kona TaxID=1008807 RepID=A0AAW2ZFU7_9EUKA